MFALLEMNFTVIKPFIRVMVYILIYCSEYKFLERKGTEAYQSSMSMMVGSMGIMTDGDDGESSSATAIGRNSDDDDRFHDVERRNGGDGVDVIAEGNVDVDGRDGCKTDGNRLTSVIVSAGSTSLSSSDS